MKKFKLFFLLGIFLFLSLLIYTPISAQVPCPSSSEPDFDGLVTAVGTITDLTSIGKCVTGDSAAIILEQAKFKVESYDSLKITFFEQAKLPADGSVQKVEMPQGDYDVQSLSFSQSSADYLYLINGNLTVQVNDNIPDATTAVFFVEGDLAIKNDINHNASNAGLTFIAKGDIKIDPNVKNIDAILISSKEICSAYDFNLNDCPNSQVDTEDPLTVNGSLISLDANFPIQFKRSLDDNSASAAEKVVYQPKYVVILKNLLSRDLLILKEE